MLEENSKVVKQQVNFMNLMEAVCALKATLSKGARGLN